MKRQVPLILPCKLSSRNPSHLLRSLVIVASSEAQVASWFQPRGSKNSPGQNQDEQHSGKLAGWVVLYLYLQYSCIYIYIYMYSCKLNGHKLMPTASFVREKTHTLYMLAWRSTTFSLELFCPSLGNYCP